MYTAAWKKEEKNTKSEYTLVEYLEFMSSYRPLYGQELDIAQLCMYIICADENSEMCEKMKLNKTRSLKYGTKNVRKKWTIK
jgi:hypothetical protein